MTAATTRMKSVSTGSLTHRHRGHPDLAAGARAGSSSRRRHCQQMMNTRALVLALVGSTTVQAAELDFYKDVYPFLKANCIRVTTRPRRRPI